MKSVGEDQLVESIRRRDSRAYETLLCDYGPRLLSTARRMCRNDADAADVLQDAMVNCLRHVDSFQGQSTIYTWLHRIVVTTALMKLRTRRRRRENSIESLIPAYYDDGHRVDGGKPQWAESAEQIAQRTETGEIVRKCIDQLPENYRIVLLMRDIEQLGTAEVAELLGANEGVVKTRLHRARQALKTLLEPHFSVKTDR